MAATEPIFDSLAPDGVLYRLFPMKDGRILAVPVVPGICFLRSSDTVSTPPEPVSPDVMARVRRIVDRIHDKRKSPKRGRHPNPRKGRARSADPRVGDDPIRVYAERLGCYAAAKHFKVSYQTVYGRAARHGWKLPPRGVSKNPMPEKKSLRENKASGPHYAEASGPSRRCDSCYQLTRSDPCHQCGTKWKGA